MDQSITRRNLITGEPAEAQPTRRDYFELEIVAKPYGYTYGTSQDENFCAYGTKISFNEAWQDALTMTPIGATAWEAQPRPIDPGTHPDSPVYSGEGFDPYAGNLDQLFESHAEVNDYGHDYSWE